MLIWRAAGVSHVESHLNRKARSKLLLLFKNNIATDWAKLRLIFGIIVLKSSLTKTSKRSEYNQSERLLYDTTTYFFLRKKVLEMYKNIVQKKL